MRYRCVSVDGAGRLVSFEGFGEFIEEFDEFGGIGPRNRQAITSMSIRSLVLAKVRFACPPDSPLRHDIEAKLVDRDGLAAK